MLLCYFFLYLGCVTSQESLKNFVLIILSAVQFYWRLCMRSVTLFFDLSRMFQEPCPDSSFCRSFVSAFVYVTSQHIRKMVE